MLFLMSFLLGLGPNEINIANSLDWLYYHSGTVATVEINSVKEESFALADYESSITMDATIQEVYKGNEPTSKQIIIYSRLSYIGVDAWKNMLGKQVLVFLKDVICERQCVYTIWDDDRGMINLTAPGEKALTGDFRVLKSAAEIFKYGHTCMQRLKNKTAKPAYLEVPKDTDAHAVLYSGSSCYIMVPDVLYAKATPSMF
jgi:hypothetical protein